MLIKFLRQSQTILTIGIPYFVYRYPSRVRIKGGCAYQALVSGSEVITVKKSGKEVEEKVPSYVYGALKAMKTNSEQSVDLLQKISCATFFTPDYKNKEEVSRDIRIFQKLYGIKAESSPQKFNTFNDFFSRKDFRPLQVEGSDIVCSPADCRMMVFDSINSAKAVWVKGDNFSVSELLKGCADVSEFLNGALCICRLCPYDSHRFTLPITATEIEEMNANNSSQKLFPTVPVAVQDVKTNVYTENRRKIIKIETKEFGTVYFVAIGSAYVGSIVFERPLPKNKGEELGKFQYGGSTILLLFKFGVINFETNLKQTSQEKMETYIQMGKTVGSSIAKKQ